MSWSDIGTWIGTGLSAIGAGIALWQAHQAKTAAAHAKEMRDKIVGKHTHGELSELSGILTAAFNSMNKYGPGRSVNSLKGTLPDSDADSVRAFTAQLDRHSHLLNKEFGQPSTDLRDRINNLLDAFIAAGTDNERLAKGREIYSEISIFSGNMKQILDGRVFSASA